jgi:hypothetical protein
MNKRGMVGWSVAAAAAVLTLVASPGDASASLDNFSGYVCRVYVYSSDSSSLPTASLYSEPGCTGTFLGSTNLYSASGSTYPEQTDRLYQAALAATTTDARVTGTWNVINVFGSTWRFVQTLVVNAN